MTDNSKGKKIYIYIYFLRSIKKKVTNEVILKKKKREKNKKNKKGNKWSGGSLALKIDIKKNDIACICSRK